MLTDLACRKAGKKDKAYRLADEAGLYLYVLPSGHRSWRMGYWIAKEKKRLVLGAYPAMSLQEARTARDSARALISRGIDPALHRKQEGAKRLLQAAATFKAVGDAWLAERKPGWAPTYARTVEGRLRNHLYPHWGHLPLTGITKPMVAQRLKAIEQGGLRETAGRARQNIEEIFSFAEALGYDVVNPGSVRAALRPAIQARRPAIVELEQLRVMLKAVEAAPAHPITRLASRFVALTAVRPGVAWTLPWSEVAALDPAAPVWTIPAARMKLSQERKKIDAFDHLVPLARQTVELLECVKALSGRSAWVFPSTIGGRRPMSDSTVSKLYRDNGYRGVHVPHGWRASFSTIMNERAMAAKNPGDRVVIDLMLAHMQDGIEPIYNRAAYMERRAEIAQEWADLLLEGMPSPADLITLPRR